MKRVFWLLVAISLSGCREPYDPALEKNSVNHLVVEGMINANGVTTIQLSRTLSLSEAEATKHETGASVEIESDQQILYALTEQEAGIYTSAENILPPDQQYRLRIRTSAGREYLSDFVTVKVSPPLNVSWNQDAEGVVVTANTHDPAKQSLYYKWLTEETWEINSIYRSEYVVIRTPFFRIRERPVDDMENAYRCWASQRSGSILTATTLAQSDDLIKDFPLIKIPNGSEKLTVRYSVLATQYVISKEAYEFYEIMKKNTEKMGSVFDPQPTVVRGNITCTTDPDEIIVGFIDCSVSSSQRIFISSEDANNWPNSLVCPKIYVPNSLTLLSFELSTDIMLIADPILSDQTDRDGNPIILGYNLSKANCLDCRLRGNNNRPDFW